MCSVHEFQICRPVPVVQKNKSRGKFKCKKCTYTTRSKYNLNRHKSIHKN